MGSCSQLRVKRERGGEVLSLNCLQCHWMMGPECLQESTPQGQSKSFISGFIFIIFNYVCACDSARGYVHLCAGVCRGQRLWRPLLELDFQAVVSYYPTRVLGSLAEQKASLLAITHPSRSSSRSF